MDDWIQHQALAAQQRSSARVFVAVDADREVVGLFALDQQVIEPAEVTRKAGGGLSRIPAVLLARLAIRSDCRGEGLGPKLYLEAARAAVEAAEHLPARLLVVDAKNEPLANWYERQAMTRSKTRSLRLYVSIAQLRAAFDILDAD